MYVISAAIRNNLRNSLIKTPKCYNINYSTQKLSALRIANAVQLQNKVSMLRAQTKYPLCILARNFSSRKNDSDSEDVVPGEPISDFHHDLPATVAVPEVWPHLPVIATKRNPIFPRFMKILEVSIIGLKFRISQVHAKFLPNTGDKSAVDRLVATQSPLEPTVCGNIFENR
jgi:hypothetical protein